MKKYNFDEIIDRKNTNALNTDGFRSYIFGVSDDDDSIEFPYEDDEFIRMWVADMEFATPDCVLNKIQEYFQMIIIMLLGHGVKEDMTGHSKKKNY